jgi:predicted transcriptional regulator
MQRSKLETCVNVLSVLAASGSMSLNQLATRFQVNKASLIKDLKMLKKSNLIEKQRLNKNEIVYVATQTGLRVLTVLEQLSEDSGTVQPMEL